MIFQEHASKRISFVLVTLNRVNYVREALRLAESIVGAEDELIIIDGGSTDGTQEVVAGYPDLVDFMVSEPDFGPTDAFNKGLLLARGKYVKQLTDDDTYFSDAIEQAVRVLDEWPEIDLLVCGGTRQVGSERKIVYVPIGANFGESTEDLFKYGASGCGYVYRRSSLSRTGLLNPMGVATDGEYLVQAIANKANIKFCRINMFHHPLLDHSFVVKHKQAHASDMLKIARRHCSSRFYWRYRSKMVVVRIAPLRVIARAIKGLFEMALVHPRSRRRSEFENPIWDGGFS